LVECGRHSNIDLLTLSEVQDIQGEEGNFTVKVLKHPRYIDPDKCIACGECANRCPKKKIPNEFNMNLDNRAAAYILYGQTVPLKYAIDAPNCIYFEKGKCRACEKYCPADAINFDEKEELLELNVGSVILSSGFKAHDPSEQDYFGYKSIPDVVTSMEYERLLSASGPCLGHLIRRSDQTEPKKIGWLQCVGSRNINKSDNPYCSSVCCMYAIKQAMVTAEHVEGDIEESIFYMDMRTHGKEFEEYYNNAKNKGIKFVQARIHTILAGPDGKGAVVRYFTEDQGMLEEHFDMFVLSVGLEPPEDAKELAKTLDIELNPHNFTNCSDFSPVATSRPGIYVCGAMAGPKDIPQSVMEASAAACAATKNISQARGSEVEEVEKPAEIDVRGDQVRIGVFVCSCGINIAGVVNVQEVVDYAKTLPGVVHVENNLFSCSQDTQDKMVESIKENGLNRVVVAACTPKTHEPLFQETLESAGINKYLFSMANIRNQDSWVHGDRPELATQKAKDLVRMSVSKVYKSTPLEEIKLGVNPSALVIGGGLSGITSALELATQGFETHLVEQSEQLGGNANILRTTAQGEAIQPKLQELIGLVEKTPKLQVHLKTSVQEVEGFVGNFKTTVTNQKGQETIEHGVTIIATGAQESSPQEYAYGQHKGIMTLLEMDTALTQGTLDPQNTNTAVFIQCVGSREPERPYCSRVCCTHSIKNALFLKEKNPDCQVIILYRDIRTYGERELLYQKAREKGVLFVRYDLENKPKVQTNADGIEVTVKDPILNKDLVIQTDVLGLATAIIPRDNNTLAQMYKIPLNNDKWFQEAHAKLRPVDFVNDGIFMAGMAHYPKPVEESIAQSQAAVARAITVLSRREMTLPGLVATIDKSRCVGCGVCWAICPYSAISPDENGLAEVNPALCKGCGLCMASCRSSAPNLGGFTQEAVMAEVMALGVE
jgi:heterodisulfide reductase subunit A